MKNTTPIINNDWDTILKNEFQKKSFKRLMNIVHDERKNHNIFPSEENVFTAFRLSPFSEIKLIIIGQDPYPTKGQAHGLAFSILNNKKTPPSLRNIFKEVNSDLQISIKKNRNLISWANQGVFLLNTILTVRENNAGSHQNIGWEDFTDVVISKLSSKRNNLIFLLWGAFAKTKSSLINRNKHHILETTHPSPLSAHKGFIGCKHFSSANKILIQNNQKPINWSLCSNT